MNKVQVIPVMGNDELEMYHRIMSYGPNTILNICGDSNKIFVDLEKHDDDFDFRVKTAKVETLQKRIRRILERVYRGEHVGVEVGSGCFRIARPF